MESELAENAQLKKVLLSSAEEELRKANRETKMMTLALFQLLARGSVEIVTYLDIQHRDVLARRGPFHDACGLKDMHPELKQKISALQKEIKRLQQEHSDAESKLRDFCESRAKA